MIIINIKLTHTLITFATASMSDGFKAQKLKSIQETQDAFRLLQITVIKNK